MSEEKKPYDEVTTGQEKPVKKGIVEEMGDADQIYNKPKTEYTKKLIDAIPEGKLDDIKRHLESRKQSSLSKK